MNQGRARVSIGLPVFNGENYLAEALDSLLAQTYSDFELIISDNASTDKTKEICEAYARKDQRLRYFRNENNIGAAKNFNRVFELSSGEYFKWAAHDDVILPDFLQECVQVLDQHPDVVLCHTRVRAIDESGQFINKWDREMNNLDSNTLGSPKPQDRRRFLIMRYRFCLDVFGLIRARALKKTPLIASYIGSDRNLLAELALLGKFFQIPKYLFHLRDHSGRSVRATALYSQARSAWFDPARRGHSLSPEWRWFLEYVKSVRHVSLGSYERICCFTSLGEWLWLHKRRLIKELVMRSFDIRSQWGDMLKRGKP
jgi:glycosyltransferase involved in cell wall biosynthesis